jgi:hypothetical protein
LHDIDRSMFETEIGPFGEVGELGELGELGEYASEYGEAEFGESEWELGESSETELATELLEVGSEAELDRFLGSLLSTAVGAAKRFAASDTGRQLGGILKSAAKQAIPAIGRGIGGAIDPRFAAAGGRLAQQAGSLFGLELEGLSQEDREFETARAFVRFATDAAGRAASAPPGAPPAAVAQKAAVAAATRHAPGLVPALRFSARRMRHGRWVRRGNSIVLLGA